MAKDDGKKKRLHPTKRFALVAAVVLILGGTIIAVVSIPNFKPSPAAPAQAARFYVSPSGSDSNPGSRAQPFRTINKCYQAMSPGGRCDVASGSYPSQVIAYDASKTSAVDVTIRLLPGTVLDDLTINASHLTLDGPVICNTCGQILVTPEPLDTPHYPVDVTVKNGDAKRFQVTSSHDISFIGGDYGDDDTTDSNYKELGNHIASTASTATYPQNILLEGLTIHDYFRAPGSSAHVDCLAIRNFDRVTIRNAKIYDCEAYDILIRQETTWNGPKPRNLLVENVVMQCCKTGFYNFDLGEWSGPMTFRNVSMNRGMNIDTSDSGWAPATPVTIQNSVSAAPPVATGCSQADGRFTLEKNVFVSRNNLGCTENGNVYSSPSVEWVDPTTPPYDFHLKVGALAIDFADPANSPATDLEGRARGSTPDAGADEQ